MRPLFVSLGLCATLMISGCDRQAPAPAPAPPPEEAPPTAGVPTPVVPAAPAPPASAPPTTNAPAPVETASAAVLIRVTFGGIMQREYGGVILKPDTFSPAIPADTDRRFVAVWIPDYEERDLRDASCKISVFRTPPPEEDRNKPRRHPREADLVEFDEARRIALVRFQENFPYRLDGGVKAGTGQPPHQAVVAAFRPPLLPASFLAPDPSSPPPAVALAGLSVQGDRVVINEAEALTGVAPATVPLLGEKGTLIQFARLSPGGGLLSAPYQTPALDTRPLLYEVESVQTTPGRDNTTRLRITGKLRDSLGEVGIWRGSYKRITDPDADFARALVDENPKPDKESSVYPHAKDGYITCQIPNMLNRESTGPVHVLVQLRAALKGDRGEYFAKPFLVTLTPKGALIEATVKLGHRTETVPAPVPVPVPPALPAVTPALATAGTAPQPASPSVPSLADVKKVKTESPIAFGVSIRGGREVLLNLSGAPYWKRLSLETGDWLPLPDADLAQAHVAGNKEALFVLDPASRMVRRFNATTLKVEAEQRLPEKAALIDLAASCNAIHAPLAVVSPNGVLALSPADLSILHDGIASEPPLNPASDKVEYFSSADGLNLFRSRPDSGLEPSIYKSYQGNVKGFDEPVWHVKNTPSSTVSAAFGWRAMGFRGRLCLLRPPGQPDEFELLAPPTGGDLQKVIPLSNAPLWLEIRSTAQPYLPTTYKGALYSFPTQERFIELDLPELGELSGKFHTALHNRIFFNPNAPALAIWHGPDTITLRQLKSASALPTKLPVLLNFPEAVIPRGSTWTFKPAFFGPTAGTLEMPRTPGAERKPDGTLAWNPPDGLPVSSYQITLQLRAEPPSSPEMQFNMPVLFQGGGRVIAGPPHLDPAGLESLRKGAQRGEVTKTRLVSLESRAFHSPRPVVRVHQGLNDYLLLEMEDKSLALLSISDLQIKGGVTPSPATRFFPAGESLLTFDAERGILTRLALPSLTPAATLKMPPKTEVAGIAAGENADSTVTVLVQQRLMQGNDVRERSRNVLFLDKTTLQRGPWASLSPSNERNPNGGWSNDTPVALRGGEYREGPHQMPCSLDGRTVLLPSGLLAISNTMTIGVQATGSAGSDFPNLVTTASPTADRMFVMGNMTTPTTPRAFRIGGLSDAKIMSRCGNYLAAPVQTGEVRAVTIESTEGFRPLLTLTGIDALEVKDVRIGKVANNFPCIPFGEKNLLVCMSPGGTVIQLISLNLPEVVKQVSPDTVVVTSHVRPYVLRGGTLQYQVTVNNPGAVASYRLRDTVAGATLSPEGLLIFKAPADGSVDKTRNIAIEVVLKSGGVVLHEVGIVILPTTTMPMPAEPAGANSI